MIFPTYPGSSYYIGSYFLTKQNYSSSSSPSLRITQRYSYTVSEHSYTVSDQSYTVSEHSYNVSENCYIVSDHSVLYLMKISA